MPRLIDADALLMDNSWDFYDENGNRNEACIAVENVPTVDVEPVVRCKDCKFFDHSDFGMGEEYWCKHFVSTDDTAHCHKVIEDDFCAWGERREDA